MALQAAIIRDQLSQLVADMDLDIISGTDAVVLVREYSLIEKIAAAARTLAADRVAETSAWVGQGDRSAEDWLSRETGTSVGAAARDLRTGRRVKDQPETRAAMQQGALSPEQAGAVADAVEVDPRAETTLIEAARRETFKNLQDQARRTRAAATDDAERAERHHRERSARSGTDADGAFFLSLHGPASDGARIMRLLKPLQERAFLRSRSNAAPNRDTFDNRAYDAVLTLLLGNAEVTVPAMVCSGPAPISGHTPSPPPAASSALSPSDPDRRASRNPSLFDDETPARPHDHGPPGSEPPGSPSSPPTRLPGGNNTKVIVRVDLDALLRGHTLAGETSEIAGLGPVPVTVVREMLDDAFLAIVVSRGRDIVSVAHHGRGLNAHQRTAIEAHGLRCSNIACNQSVGIQIDHRHPWAEDRVTKLDNQDPLCGPCHRRKTHQGWQLEPGSGPRRFLPPARTG